MSDQSFRECILARRESKGLTLREAARLFDVSPTHLSDIEHGRRAASEALINRIAGVLGFCEIHLQALAGLIPADVLTYIRAETQAFRLLVLLAEARFAEHEIDALFAVAESVLTMRRLAAQGQV